MNLLRAHGKQHRRHALLLAAGGTALLSALTACGPSGHSASGAPQSVSGTAAPATGSASAATGSASSAAAPVGANGGAGAASSRGSAAPAPGSGGSSGGSGGGTTSSTRCTSGDLRASVGGNNPGAGQENFPIVLTNVSGHTCTVYGFPGAEFQSSSGQAVAPDPQRITGEQYSRVSLAPGASAWAALTFSNPGISGAPTVTPARLVITPPDERSPLTVPWSGGPVPRTGSPSPSQVGPFNPGRGG